MSKLLLTSVVGVILFAVAIVTLRTQKSTGYPSSSEAKYVFADLHQGQILSGDALIVIKVHDSIDLLTLWVDGKKCASTNTENEGGGRYAAFYIPTYDYANGPHLVEVGVGRHFVFNSRNLRFQNSPRLGHAGKP